jgi:hypothetical protein
MLAAGRQRDAREHRLGYQEDRAIVDAGKTTAIRIDPRASVSEMRGRGRITLDGEARRDAIANVSSASDRTKCVQAPSSERRRPS